MKKRVALAVIVVALTTGAAAVCFRPGSCINADSYQKIEAGMTQEQIREILGGPPRNESACPFEPVQYSSGCGLEPVQYSSKFRLDEWYGPDIFISVWFDAQGRVCDKSYLDHAWGAAKNSLWDEIRSWLPL